MGEKGCWVMYFDPMKTKELFELYDEIVPVAMLYECKQRLQNADQITRKGKNWYVRSGNAEITINSYSLL